MRRAARDFLERTVSRLAWAGPVYEFGSRIVQGQPRELVDLRPLFGGAEYHGCDLVEGPGVDEVRDVYEPELPRESVGVVVLADLLEHLERPRAALAEAGRILRHGGLAIVTTLFRFPIHEYPGDFWRFTPAGLASVLEEVGPAVVKHDPLEWEKAGVYGFARKESSPCA